MTDFFAQEYSRFAKEKLRPAVNDIAIRKRTGLLTGLLAGALVFLCGAGAVYLLLAPYREFMQGNNMTFWPLMLLAPAALGVLVFSLVFVLSLRKTVANFRNALADGMGEFIDPGLVHETAIPLSRDLMTASHLFGDGGGVSLGSDRFRGRAGEAAVEFTDMWEKAAQKEPDANAGLKNGLFFVAHYENAFPHPFFVFPAGVDVSRSSLENALEKDGYTVPGGLVRVEQDGKQYLVPSGEESSVSSLLTKEVVAGLKDVRVANGGELYLAARDNTMYFSILSPAAGKKGISIFEAFDFDGCREFCRNAKLALTTARQSPTRQGVTRRFLS